MQPVIVIGMHRSGTSMVTRMLDMMGLFVGEEKDRNHEAQFFRHLDIWLIGQCGGSWEYPQPVYNLIENPEARAMTTDYLERYLLPSLRAVSYLGWKKYLRYRSPANLPIPWGWKTPLSTYTLPLWLDLFPRAKVIHIYRHGVDVANSLRARVRREGRQSRMQQMYYRWPMLHSFRPKSGGFVSALRCATLEGGLSLWEEYLTEARKHVRNLEGRSMELKYEDFLAQPAGALQQLAAFCGLALSDAELARVAGHVKKERAYAYRESPELRAFSEHVTERLNALGY